ncbi:unnamed protein product [Allacma fusca]|uniref:Venom dipeptidyl peptidase 4 n=1 Tax=Allacma fusca TaxID=39272 RepID=A0A8J2LB97_9HEXA|nr:unnamed protein product [Allacma fusca]
MNPAQSSEDFPATRTTNTERKAALPIQGTRRGLLAALGVGVVLVILVISAAVYVNQNSRNKNETNLRLVADGTVRQGNGRTITLPDILQGVYGIKGNNATWVSDLEMQYVDQYGNIALYNVDTRSHNTIIPGIEFINQLRAVPFQVTLSPDKKFALVGYHSQKLYRHSIYAKYDIYDVEKNTFDRLIPEPEHQNPRQPDLLQLVQWSPKVGHNAVAFVYDNNVFFKSGPTKEIKSLRLTSTGSHQIYNGVADWVYEEEMFGGSKALWFSPQGTNLAFASFNDTEVKSIQFPVYGDPGQFPRNQYPFLEEIPYPKAGTANPSVEIYIANVGGLTGDITPRPIELSRFEVNYYVGTVVWATDMEVLVVTMNRHQTDLRGMLCNEKSECQEIVQVKEAKGWIDINTPRPSNDGSRFLMLKSEKIDGADKSYRHIVQFDRNGIITPVTTGRFSVDSIVAWDEASNKVFFTSTRYNDTTQEADPSEAQFYSIAIGTTPQKATCITCGLQNLEKTTECRQNSVELSKGFSHFIHQCLGPSVPEVLVRSVQNASVIKETWVDNSELKGKLQLIDLPIIQDYSIPLASGFVAKARLWIPPNYQKGKKYPMLVDVYGGPGSQKLDRRFGINWGTSLTLSRDVIYASIDGRGSGRQSDDLLFQLYLKLGTVEIEDQIAGAKWLIQNNVDDIIDANRTAIWGWSYGGYSTAMVMGTDKQGIYKCGISVAPVTSWVFYDTIYTERYMGLPTKEDNLANYNASDVTNHVENFRTKKYYLIHGNADDNVHYQQSMILSRALEKADILFRQQSYPDEDHSLGSVRRHFFKYPHQYAPSLGVESLSSVEKLVLTTSGLVIVAC